MRKKDGIQCNIQKCLELHKSCCFAWMLFQAHLTVKALLMICEMPRLHNRFSCICTLGVQGSIWFFGAETPQSGVILVAGREPGCLVCLAIAAFLLPKNSAGPAGGQKSGLARPQDEGGLNLPPRTRTQPTLILAAGRHVAPCTPRVLFLQNIIFGSWAEPWRHRILKYSSRPKIGPAPG